MAIRKLKKNGQIRKRLYNGNSNSDFYSSVVSILRNLIALTVNKVYNYV